MLNQPTLKANYAHRRSEESGLWRLGDRSSHACTKVSADFALAA